MKFSEIDFGKWAAILITVSLGGALGYCAIRYLLPVGLPFLLAWGLALVLRPLNYYLNRRLGIPLRVASLLTVTLSFLVAGGLLYAFLGRLVAELRGAVVYLTSEPGPLDALLGEIEGGEGLLGYASALADHLASALMSAIPPLLGSAVLTLPGVLLFLLVTVVASFYFCLDLSSVHEAIRRLLPTRVGALLGRVRQGAWQLGLSYLRSYLILTAAIFCILLVGLTVLGVDYALLLSLLLAAVDILPVVGAGTVLVPWGLVLLLIGKQGMGVGILVLFGVSEVARHILEPRLLGSALGIHPLLSLLSLYAGARLFGVFGLVLGPLFAVVLRLLFRLFSEKTKNPSCDGISVGHARSTLPERRQREQT